MHTNAQAHECLQAHAQGTGAHAHMLRGIDEVLSVNVSLEHPSDFDFQGMGGGHLFACEVSLDE